MADTDDPGKIKIAVLGGGCGAMAAACYLSSTEELRRKYEVTVYQQGWRLGGKGATGRDRRADYGERIYEHGLHMWLGWYDNAFKLIQDVYTEWQKKPENPFKTWQDAFAPQRFFTLQQDIPEAGSVRWVTRNITMPKLPGTPGEASWLTDLEDYFVRLVEWLHQSFRASDFFGHRSQKTEDAPVHVPWIEALVNRLAQEADVILGHAREETHPSLLHVQLAAARLADDKTAPGALESGALHGIASHFLADFQHWLHSPFIRAIAAVSDSARWYWEMLDFATAAGLGIVTDILPHGKDGIAMINDEDFSKWIGRHGADVSTQWSAFTRAVYNLAFSFEGGVSDQQHAAFEAGTALMIYLRMALGYKDAPMWRMLGGMGDTIFAPIHEVLKQRGVKFKFFHRVKNLLLSADKRLVAAVEMEVQATIKDGAEYHPLFDVHFANGKSFPCWPDEPLWEQIEDADRLKAELAACGLTFESAWCSVGTAPATLRQGTDFDHIVLGISVAGVKEITAELSDADAHWHCMVESLRTVETQAVQLWMTPPLRDLGWPNDPTVMTTYTEPFDTWGEMSEVLPMENWSGTTKPQSLHYFCGAMPGPAEPPLSDPHYPALSVAEVKQTALRWLGGQIGHIWPDAVITGTQGLDFSKLHDPNNQSGTARFDSQYWRANIDPSERYVASFPDTSKHRLWSDNSGFDNLFLAGDWTVSSVNGGCVEAAVESGMAASRGICGVPEKIPNYPDRPQS